MKNKKRLLKENFCLIKYRFNALGMMGVEYEVIFHPEKEDTGANIVTKDEAMEIIEKFNMQKVLTTKNGTIWEKENQPFLTEHQNFFAKKEAEEERRRLEQEKRALALKKREAERQKKNRMERAKELARQRSAQSAEENSL